jgi:hypothetical protein
MNRIFRELVAFCLFSLSIWPAFSSEERVNHHAKLIADFQNRVASYLKLHNQADADLPRLKPTDSAELISAHEQELAQKVRMLRPNAKQGEIFTVPIAAEFRRLVKIASRGQEASTIRRSLEHAEPVLLAIRVNDTYPKSVPLQSTPATLLRNLPVLPKQLQYRVIGHDLVLLDVGADLIVDFAEKVIP